MGIFDFISKKNDEKKKFEECQKQCIERANQREQEELNMVLSVTNEDMRKFSMLPFHFQSQIQKLVEKNIHPCAYMDLDKANQIAAVAELEKINVYIHDSVSYSDIITSGLEIPIKNIVYRKYAEEYRYSTLKCTPKTKTGKPAKIPLEFQFTTKLYQPEYRETKSGFEPVYHDTTFGSLFYGQDGSVVKGHIHFWRNGIGFFYDLGTVGRTLLIKKIRTTAILTEKNLPSLIYEFE